MSYTKSLRLARPEDTEDLLKLLKSWHGEESKGPFDEAKVRMVVERGVRRDMAVIGVIQGRYAIEASIGLYIGSDWFNTADMLVDLWNYVLQPYRRSSHAKSLNEFAKDYALSLKKTLAVTVLVNENTVHKAGLLERQYGGARGRLYLFDPSETQPVTQVTEALEPLAGSKRKLRKLARAGVLVYSS